MQAARIDELTAKKQLSAKRNVLFEELLQNPVNVGLVNEIRSIDARIAELTKDFRAKQESEHD